MGLVSTWLTGIGLAYAWPNFEAAGIVTPSALASLDVNMFVSLGVKDAEDRRKLFYLVQRIKLAVTEEGNADQQDNVATAVDRVLAGTLNPSEDENKQPSEDDEDSPVADDAMPVEKPTPQSPSKGSPAKAKGKTKTNATAAVSSPRSTKPQSTRVATSPRYRSSPPKSPSRSSPIKSPRQQQQKSARPASSPRAMVQSRTQNSSKTATATSSKASSRMAQPAPSRRSMSLSAPKSRLPSKNASRISSATARKSEIGGKLAEKDEGEGPMVDEEMVDLPKGDKMDKGDDTDLDSPRSVSEPENNKRSPDNIAARTRGARSRMSQSKKSPPRRRTETSKSRIKTPSTAPASRPGRAISQPRSNRTGKALSTIPSDRILPMSPLMDTNNRKQNSEASPEKTADESDEMDPIERRRFERSASYRRQNSSTRRKTMHGIVTTNSEDMSDSERSDKSDRSSRSVSSRNSAGSKNNRRRSSVSVRNNNNDRRRTLANPGSTFLDDDGERPESFKSQIEVLREDNEEEYKEHSLTNMGEDEDMRIRVVIRKRPMSKAEVVAAGDVDVIHPLDYGNYGKVLVYQPRTRVDLTKEIDTLPFCYDNVYGEDSTNSQIYERSIRNLIPPFFEGQWGCVFAYGQTGAGKTYTMMGSNMTTHQQQSKDLKNLGIYYMAALDVFAALGTEGFEHFSVKASLFEIYGGKLFDLLNARQQVKCLEDHKGKVRFPGLSEHSLNSAEDLIAMIEEGSCNRSTGSTSRNADSSRSHAVLQLHLHKPLKNRRAGKTTGEFSRLTFIDLAGSERGADTSNASRETRMEGAEINTSLLALKEVLRALATGDSMTHVPFRGSKLTQVLKESFVGTNCRSVMIACISPNIGNCEQTLNTLRYANRVKERNSETGQVSGFVSAMSRQTNGVGSKVQKVIEAEERKVDVKDDDEAVAETTRESDDESAGSEPAGSPTGATANGSPSKNPIPPSSPAKSARSMQSSFDDQASVGSNDSNVLDEILGESDPVGKAAQQVILTHKDTMGNLLEMVKDEMTLVNQPGSERGMEQYISAINDIHARQLNMYALLRERIQEYRALREAAGGAPDSASVVSFEDLRD